LVDGPAKYTGVNRQAINLKRLALTDIVIKNLQRGASSKVLTRLFKEQKVKEQWKNTRLAQKIASQKARANLNDFGRYLVDKAKRRRSRNVTVALTKVLREKKLENPEAFGISNNQQYLTALKKQVENDKNPKPTKPFKSKALRQKERTARKAAKKPAAK